MTDNVTGLPTYGQRVKARRIHLGLSRAELARRAGLNAKTVGNIEDARHQPEARTAAVLNRALGWQDLPPGATPGDPQSRYAALKLAVDHTAGTDVSPDRVLQVAADFDHWLRTGEPR